ncbi:hypothetical protein Cpir12675_002941 [Ceratocystis pirilliformis]|uniref:Extracellular serine-rich protein n=1 Tax=Ceratocystis pirilliformis TaxID=259994 RepID=A0ABR3Z660_9PEZI
MKFPFVVLLSAASSLASTDESHLRPRDSIIVKVTDHTFEPLSLNVEVGKSVWFEFYGGTHSIVQADYNYPCQQLESGFATGSFTTDPESGKPNRKALLLYIKDKNPIWFYNGAEDQCHKYGAVGVINPPENDEQNIYEFSRHALGLEYTENPEGNTVEGAWITTMLSE